MYDNLQVSVIDYDFEASVYIVVFIKWQKAVH